MVDSKQWCNVLAVIELLFCLPISNGHLESVFSQLKLINVNRRTYLCEEGGGEGGGEGTSWGKQIIMQSSLWQYC